MGVFLEEIVKKITIKTILIDCKTGYKSSCNLVIIRCQAIKFNLNNEKQDKIIYKKQAGIKNRTIDLFSK